MIAPITTLGLYGGPVPAPNEGLVPVVGPVVILAFILPLGGPVPNVILPPVPQSCQNSVPNIVLQALVVDQDGDPVDLSAAALLEFLLLAPDGVTQPVVASFVSNGYDGLIQYITDADDLTEVGLWQLQARLTFGTQVLLTRLGTFGVDSNVEDL